MQDVAGGRDRIRAEEQRASAFHRRRDESQRGRAVAGDVAIESRSDSRGRHFVRAREHLGRLAVVEPGLEHFNVRLENLGRLLETALEVAERALDRPLIQPRQHAEHEHVAASEHRAIVQTHPMHGERRELGHIDFDHLEFVERMVGERIALVAGALDVGIGERFAVDDYHGVGRDIFDVRLERRGIHRDQHVGLVARGENLAAGKI